MERRDFLRAGVVASGSVGLGAVGCGAVLEGISAVPVPSVAQLQALDMDGFLQGLDSSLGFIQSTNTLDSIVSKEVQRSARAEPRFEQSDDTVRKMIRSMLLVGSFGDLPEVGRVHPGVQARLWNSMQEMDDAVFGMNRVLTSLTPSERADIRRRMREDASAGPRVLGALDDEAVKAGVNLKRREHMREVAKHACFRLRQSTEGFIDEYDDKVKRVSARDASAEEVQRRLMAQLGETAFWEYHSRQFALAQAWQQVPGIAQAGPAVAGPPAVAVPPAYSSPTATGSYLVYPVPPGSAPPGGYGTVLDAEGRDIKKLKKGNTLLAVGGGLLGLGLIAGGIGALVVASAGLAGAFVVTAAVLLGLAGIICLIIGGVIRGRA